MRYPRPERIEQVPGTQFAVAILGAPRDVSGVAWGSLAAGVASILICLPVWLFGLAGAEAGWGGLVAGAFAALGILLGLGGVVLGWVALRRIKRSAVLLTGRGMAITGLICGGCGVLFASLGILVTIVLSLGSAA